MQELGTVICNLRSTAIMWIIFFHIYLYVYKKNSIKVYGVENKASLVPYLPGYMVVSGIHRLEDMM